MLRPLIIYSLLQAALSIGVFKLTNYADPLTIAFWAVSSVASVMYLIVHMKDVLDIA